MCQYCGCRAVPLIRDYIAEHDHVLNLLDGALRAIAVDDLVGAAGHVSDAREALASHWTGEENGIFKVMAARDDEYASYVAPLVEEHRELRAVARPPGRLGAERPAGAAQRPSRRPREHISKEEDGLFPASLIVLSGDDWNASMTAWQQAHPGESMLAD